LFWNGGGRGFRLCAADACGPYFSGQYLGRSAARLDWDCNGAPDLAVTHLDAPAALLINESEARGHFLALRFVGTHSERDGTGVLLRLHTGSHEAAFEVTAGDGYQCSNERLLIVGLGPERVAGEMTVEWPSGRIDRYSDVPSDRRLTCVEGHGAYGAAGPNLAPLDAIRPEASDTAASD
jgi:hypothetical protein